MRRNLSTDIALGAFGSVLAGMVVDQVTTVLYEHEDPKARKREDTVRGGKTAMERAAEKAAKAAGKKLTAKERKKLGQVVHWSISVGAGAAYGTLWNNFPRFRVGSGVLFGILHWLVLDEGANSLLGITPPPRAFPWQAHLRGLVGHVVFGATLEALFHAADLAGQVRES